jgi:hypothetical protein
MEHHLSARLVVQVDPGLDAAEGTGYIIHNVVNELVEVEDRSYFLSRFLQLLQLLDLIGAQRANRDGIGRNC